jgi:GNAT superfamily N-acetyltransferase
VIVLHRIPFDRERDLARLLDLVAAARMARESDFLHPGGLQWLLRRLVNPDFEVSLWAEDAVPVAYSVVDGEYAMIGFAPEHVKRRLELIATIEDRMRAAGRAAIEISVWDDDRLLREAVAERGYAPSGTGHGSVGYELVYRAPTPPVPVLPAGFAFVPFEPSMDDAYVAMHRDAWSSVAPSTYRRELHDIVTSMPDFRRDMVPIVAAPEGALAAYCIGWLDRRTDSVEIEPLGTHPVYRRLGLAHAVVAEVIRRAYAHGARSVLVWGSEPNTAAIQLYRTSGMRSTRTLREYRKAL